MKELIAKAKTWCVNHWPYLLAAALFGLAVALIR